MVRLLSSVIIFIFMFNMKVYAEEKVVVNEFLIEPAAGSQVELYNAGSEVVDISQWYIDDSGGQEYFTIPGETTLASGSCIVLTGNLRLNVASGDTIRLISSFLPPTDSNAKTIDSFSYTKSPGPGISFYRENDGTGNWVSGLPSLGKLNSNGNTCMVLPTAAATLFLTFTPTPSAPLPTLIPTVSQSILISDIYISEVMAYPTSGNTEWVELYNDNNSTVSLINWYIDDSETGSSPKLFSLDIPSHSYAVIEMTSSIYNNDEDEVRLLDADRNLKDSFSYTTTQQGKTIGRENFLNSTYCLQEPTKSQENNSCSIQTVHSVESLTPTVTISPTAANTTTNTKISVTPTLRKQTIKTDTWLFENEEDSLDSIDENKVEDIQGEVLGASEVNHQWILKTTALFLGFLSYGFSLLTIGIVLLRMKHRL